MEETVEAKNWKRQDPRGYTALCQTANLPPSQQSSGKEALTAWANPLFSEVALIVYGLEGGGVYEALQPWLKENPRHDLLILEESLSAISAFLASKSAPVFFSDRQAKLLWVPPEKDQEPFLQDLLEFNKYRPVHFTSSPAVVNAPDRYLFIRAAWSYLRQGKAWSLSEVLDGGITHFSNFYRNLIWLTQATPIEALSQACTKVPAIIVGAGPSLQTNGALLHALRQKAVILSGGTALNILNQMGIIPHIALGVDPNQTHTERLLSNSSFEIPFVYKNRIHHDALWTLSNPLCFMPAGPSSFAMEKYVEQKLSITPFPFSGGGNVLNMATQLAYFLGCDPIVFVGIDLAYTNGQNYARGIERDPFYPDLTRSRSNKEEVLWREDIYGKPIQTLWKWIYEAFWYGGFQGEHRDRTFLNATEGGLGFPNVRDIRLAEFAKTLPKESREIDQLLQTKIEESKDKKIPFEKIVDLYDELFQGLKRLYTSILHLEGLGERELSSLKSDPFFPCFQVFLTNYQEVHDYLVQDRKEKVEELPSPLTHAKQIIEYHLAEISSAIRTAADFRSLFFGESAPANKPQAQAPEQSAIKTAYYDNNQMRSQIPYNKEGRIEGWALFYWANGKLKRRCYFREGKKEGSDEFFRLSGELWRKAFYRNNLPVGKALEWDQSGVLHRVLEYHEGRFVDEKRRTPKGEWVDMPKAADFWTDLILQSKKMVSYLKTSPLFLANEGSPGQEPEEFQQIRKKIDSLSQLSDELSARLDVEHESLATQVNAIRDTQKRLNYYTLSMNEWLYEIDEMINLLKSKPDSQP